MSKAVYEKTAAKASQGNADVKKGGLSCRMRNTLVGYPKIVS